MTRIHAKLEQLFEFDKKLNQLLDEEQYELFQQQQDLFSDLLKDFLNRHSEDELNSVLAQLKSLRSSVKLLQERTIVSSKQLKEKSLLLQRNKNKIKAYK